ncbi:MAG TPA: amidohydrolase family protein [Terriglobia bacterium]
MRRKRLKWTLKFEPYQASCAFLCLLSWACGSLVGAQEQGFALRGTLVTPDDVVEQGTVLIEGATIRDAGREVPVPPGTRVIETGGFIYPGLIDLHNHVTWNVFPRWTAKRLFSNRYEWQQLPEYKMALDVPHQRLVAEGLGCAMERYAELKAVAGGATSQAGLSASDTKPGTGTCLGGGERELGVASRLYPGGSAEKLGYEVFPLTMDETYSAKLQDALKKHEMTALLVHLGEGKPQDASAMEEYWILKGRGLLLPGVSLIHGSALQATEFQEMARIGVGLVWSPRSNFELYGGTTDVATAKRAGVRMALAPDWSPTGSDGMLEELKYAAAWNATQTPAVFGDAELVRMATEDAAALAGVGDLVGTVKKGQRADLLVVRSSDKNPYDALPHASPADVELVVIDGRPVYGDGRILEQTAAARQTERVQVCGVEKTVAFGGRWNETIEDLQVALRQWGESLAPLAACQ